MHRICLLLLLTLLPGIVGSPAVASSAGEKAISNPITKEDQLYKSAKDVFYALERAEAGTGVRSQWLSGIRNFRRIYLAAPKSSLAPSCLYMIARMYRQMYKQFQLPIDIDEAISHYTDIATMFPGSILADDALFAIAEIELTDKNNPNQAAKNFRAIIDRYPNGDRSNQSISHLQAIARQHNIKQPETTEPQAKVTHDLVDLQPIQHWSSSDYTRIVIRASEPVHYETRLLEKNDNEIYKKWAMEYLSNEYKKLVEELISLMNEAKYDEETKEIFITASKYEYYFWEMAYKMEEWII